MSTARSHYANVAPQWARRLAMLAFATGLAVSGMWLFAPSPGALPPMLAPAPLARPDTAAAARWFSGAALRIRVEVVGMIATGDATTGAALLSVDGGPARAYRVGQELAAGVRLAAVTAQGVEIDQDGIVELAPAPARPPDAGAGFVSAPTR